MNNRLLKIRAISWVIVFIILHSSFIISEAQRSKEIYIQVIDTAGLAASVVADTSWILGQIDIVRAELADTSETIQNIIELQRRLYFAPYYIGQDTLGGIIYDLYLDEAGEVHGYIMSTVEEYRVFDPPIDSTNMGMGVWVYEYDTLPNTSYFNGQLNQSLSIAQKADTVAAFYYCDTLTSMGQTDWYLPAFYEMTTIINNHRLINESLDENGYTDMLYDNTIAALDNIYWTSTYDPASNGNVLTLNVLMNTFQQIRKRQPRKCRCIRKF